jgi:hypothetical protein
MGRREPVRLLHLCNVRFWHKAEIAIVLNKVRFRGVEPRLASQRKSATATRANTPEFRKDRRTGGLSIYCAMSAFGPKRTWRGRTSMSAF